MADYRAAAQIFPDDHVTLFNLGRPFRNWGSMPRPSPRWNAPSRSTRARPSCLLTLAASYEQLSRLPDAVQAYRDFLDREPRAPEASVIRARIGRLEQVGVPDGSAQTTSAPSPGA